MADTSQLPKFGDVYDPFAATKANSDAATAAINAAQGKGVLPAIGARALGTAQTLGGMIVDAGRAVGGAGKWVYNAATSDAPDTLPSLFSSANAATVPVATPAVPNAPATLGKDFDWSKVNTEQLSALTKLDPKTFGGVDATMATGQSPPGSAPADTSRLRAQAMVEHAVAPTLRAVFAPAGAVTQNLAQAGRAPATDANGFSTDPNFVQMIKGSRQGIDAYYTHPNGLDQHFYPTLNGGLSEMTQEQRNALAQHELAAQAQVVAAQAHAGGMIGAEGTRAASNERIENIKREDIRKQGIVVPGQVANDPANPALGFHPDAAAGGMVHIDENGQQQFTPFKASEDPLVQARRVVAADPSKKDAVNARLKAAGLAQLP